MAVVISLLAGILLERLLFYQEMAERANVESMISRFKSGLRIHMAEMLIHGRAQEYPSLATENPVDWLDEKPENYRGHLPAKSPSELKPGNWYYDPSTHTLIYLVKHGRYFKPDSTGLKRVRLHVVLVLNPDSDSKQPRVLSVQMLLVEPYRWF